MQFHRQRAFWEVATIVGFLGLIWMPTADYFLGLDHAPAPVENRRQAQWPHFGGIGDSRGYIAGIESYFNDHFGFRKRLVRWHNRWKADWFDDSVGENVLIGSDGWLYFAGCEMLAHWNRQKTWSEPDLEHWRRLLESRRDWLRDRGCAYVLVVPPDKHTIYPEHLPDWMEQSVKPSKLQQLTAYMKSHSTVEVLDLTASLMASKKIRVNYLQTDTHWNGFGAFMAYRDLMEVLARQMPGLQPLPLDAYEWKHQVRPPGDLTILLGRKEGFREDQFLRAIPSTPMGELKVLNDPLRFPRRRPEESKTCYTLNESVSGKAMVFRDSFASRWYPLLGRHFREVIYVWHHDWDRPLIEREKPDVVIDEILERFLNLVDPVEMLAMDENSFTNTCIGRVEAPEPAAQDESP